MSMDKIMERLDRLEAGPNRPLTIDDMGDAESLAILGLGPRRDPVIEAERHPVLERIARREVS